MNIIGAILFCVLAGSAVAQVPDLNDTPAETVIKDGRYFTVTLFLGHPMRIFVAGKERAKLDLSKLKLEVNRVPADGSEKLEVNRDGNYYVIKDTGPLSLSGAGTVKTIEVKTTLPKKSETFQFKLKKP